MTTTAIKPRFKLFSLFAILCLLVTGSLATGSALASSMNTAPDILGNFEVGSTVTGMYTIPASCKSCTVRFTWLVASASVDGTATSKYVARASSGPSYLLTNDDLGKIFVLKVALRGPRSNIVFRSAPSNPVVLKASAVSSPDTETSGTE